MSEGTDKTTWIRAMGNTHPQSDDLLTTIAYNEWALERDSEKVLWGRGVLFVDITDAGSKGYKLYEGENTAWNEYSHDLWAIYQAGSVDDVGRLRERDADAGHGYPIGFAIGEVERKMTPAASPDVTALRVAPDEALDPATVADGGAVVEDHEVCPECGLQFSAKQPAESFHGSFAGGGFLRACFSDGRVFMHSEGDVRGYPPEAFE